MLMRENLSKLQSVGNHKQANMVVLIFIVFDFSCLTFLVRSFSFFGKVIFHFGWGHHSLWVRSSSMLGEVVFHFGWGSLPFWVRSSSILGEVVFHFGWGRLKNNMQLLHIIFVQGWLLTCLSNVYLSKLFKIHWFYLIKSMSIQHPIKYVPHFERHLLYVPHVRDKN